MIRGRVLVTGVGVRAQETKAGVDGHDGHIRHPVINTLGPERGQIEGFRSELRQIRPIDGPMKRAHCCRADQIRLAESKRVHVLKEMSVSARQDILAVIVSWLVPVGIKIAPEQRVLGV